MASFISNSLLRSLLPLLSATLSTYNVSAESRTVRGTFTDLFGSGTSPIYISIPSDEGLERFSFEVRKRFRGSDGEIHLQGRSLRRSSNGSYNSATLSIAGRTGWLFYTSRRKGEMKSARLNIHSSSFRAASGSEQKVFATVQAISHAGHTKSGCGTESASAAQLMRRSAAPSVARAEVSPPLTIRTAGTDPFAPLFLPPRVLEVAVLSDYEFSTRYGAKTQSYIRAAFNAAEGIYTRQLGIRLDIVQQQATNTPNQFTDGRRAEEVLESFRQNVSKTRSLGDADTFHLFTGKSLLGTTIGLSYVESACDPAGLYNFGLSQAVNKALQPLLLAHELGHSLGASHDNASGSIMSAYLIRSDTRFTSQSLNEIGIFVMGYGSCLALGDTNEISLSVTTRANFKTTVKISSAYAQRCTLSLYGSRTAQPFTISSSAEIGGTLLAQQTIVTNGNYEGTTVTFTAAAPTSPKLASTIYFRGLLSCPDSSASSPSASIRLGTLSAAGAASVGSDTWLKRLRRNLAAAKMQSRK